MRFTITAQDTDRPLQLDIRGYHLEVSGMATGSILVSDSDGCISVRYIETAPLERVSAATSQAAVGSIEILQPDVPVSAVVASQVTVPVSAVTPQVDLPVIEAGMPQTAEPEKVTTHSFEGTELSDKLFSHLVVLRKQIAAEVNLPPYIIFHDSTLRDMCRLLPSDLEELRAVQGVGQAKLEKYGLRFIQAIHELVSHVKEVA